MDKYYFTEWNENLLQCLEEETSVKWNSNHAPTEMIEELHRLNMDCIILDENKLFFGTLEEFQTYECIQVTNDEFIEIVKKHCPKK